MLKSVKHTCLDKEVLFFFNNTLLFSQISVSYFKLPSEKKKSTMRNLLGSVQCCQEYQGLEIKKKKKKKNLDLDLRLKSVKESQRFPEGLWSACYFLVVLSNKIGSTW
ncbi:hypothetical protein EK904_013488 [Melospiza melodia maxima]|nr:hypothetical protein EK904_013488 [Melospiza melodia maxima]